MNGGSYVLTVALPLPPFWIVGGSSDCQLPFASVWVEQTKFKPVTLATVRMISAKLKRSISIDTAGDLHAYGCFPPFASVSVSVRRKSQ